MDLKECNNINHRHPWELSRIIILKKTINKFCPESKTWLDIGSGDCYVYSNLKELGYFFLIDPAFTSINANDNFSMHRDIEGINLNKINTVLMLDSLEHIENDLIFLKEFSSKCLANTTFIITVPALSFLFCQHDIYLNHYRRYNFEGLKNIIIESKLRIEKIHYFYFTLFLLRFFEVYIMRKQSFKITQWMASENSILTNIIVFILYIDFKICELLSYLKIQIPGLSLIVVAKKL
jgi:hypothetical protein